MGALFGAILNARAVFGPAAWAPVLNNVVALAALAVYWFLPDPPDGGVSHHPAARRRRRAARWASSCRPP